MGLIVFFLILGRTPGFARDRGEIITIDSIMEEKNTTFTINRR